MCEGVPSKIRCVFLAIHCRMSRGRIQRGQIKRCLYKSRRRTTKPPHQRAHLAGGSLRDWQFLNKHSFFCLSFQVHSILVSPSYCLTSNNVYFTLLQLLFSDCKLQGKDHQLFISHNVRCPASSAKQKIATEEVHFMETEFLNFTFWAS